MLMRRIPINWYYDFIRTREHLRLICIGYRMAQQRARHCKDPYANTLSATNKPTQPTPSTFDTDSFSAIYSRMRRTKTA